MGRVTPEKAAGVFERTWAALDRSTPMMERSAAPAQERTTATKE
jgi:hypothetical protein